MPPVLRVEELRAFFDTYDGVVRALDGVTFEINAGETFGLVGETGCGKTVTALSIMRLLPENGRIVSGRIFFDGENLLDKSEEEMRKLRGGKISMIFQDPSVSLNPVYTVGEQITRVIMIHQNVGKKEAERRAVEAFKLVALPEPEAKLRTYPHELSGGMQQRVMIAMALSSDPDVLIADEPTSAVDVTIQAQILERIHEIADRRNLAILLITHNMGIVAETCDRVGVMYAGTVAEVGDVRQVLKKPVHPYTKGLLTAIPRRGTKDTRLSVIKGSIPDLINRPAGCPFHPRCPFTKEICQDVVPRLQEADPGRLVSCHLAKELMVT